MKEGKGKKLTNIRIHPRLREQRNESRQERRTRTRPFLPNTPLRHMHMHVYISHELVIRRRRYPKFVRVALHPTQSDLGAFSDDFA